MCMCAPYNKHCPCAGIAPYMAIELAVFDLIPRRHLPFARGFTAAFLATTACYPLDTVRCTHFLLIRLNFSMRCHTGPGSARTGVAVGWGVFNQSPNPGRLRGMNKFLGRRRLVVCHACDGIPLLHLS